MNWHKRFFWLLLLFLPTQLGYHFWPEWAHVLGRRVDYLSPTLYLTDILVFCTIGSYIIFNFQFSIFKKFSKIIIIFLLFATINIFTATNPMVAVYKWLKVIEFVLLGWYIVRTKPPFSFLLFPFSIGILYSSMLAIAQFFLQHSVGGPLWWLGERTFDVDTPGIARFDFDFSLFTFHFSLFGLRPYATFPHPNVLGGFLAAVLPLVIISREAGSRSARQFSIFKIITIVAGVTALFLTFSRSAIIIGFLGIVLAFRKKIFLPIAVVIALGMVFLNLQNESIVVRQQLNAAAIKLWASSPLFGVGLGNFLVRLPEGLPTRTIYFLQPVHNIYLLVLSEVGVVGAMLTLWFTWLFVKSRTSKISKTSQKFFLVFLVPLLTLLLLGLVDHYPLTLQQGQLLLTLLVGMSIAQLTNNKVTK